MLFNSLVFFFGFLPVTLLGYFVLGRVSRPAASGFVALASIVFYGWWSVAYIPLLLGSILFNFLTGNAISAQAEGTVRRRQICYGAIAANLVLLGYYKYFNFFLTNIESLAGQPVQSLNIILPLGISFFTFTQIAYLVDSLKGKVRERSFVDYVLFVTYFPHLIAGPVLHHAEMMPQFMDKQNYRPRVAAFSVGLAFFLVGLIKKVVFADGIQPFVGGVFESPANQSLSSADAWLGALAYSLQLYFDFSGYCDMAVGIARMMNIRLPYNFDSPYQSTSIVEFWRRWHMTLSRFLRDYLYIPLGGNRKGEARRYLNLFVTMLLGGLWHGAGWTFIAWGALHGLYLTVNHLWRTGIGEARLNRLPAIPTKIAGWAITMIFVVIGWVYFRATDVGAANRILSAMFGANGGNASGLRYFPTEGIPWVICLAAVAVCLPNIQRTFQLRISQQIAAYDRTTGKRLISIFAISASLVIITFLLFLNSSRGAGEFIYFNF